MNATQINNQLMPRRASRVGVGAVAAAFACGSSFIMTVQGSSPLATSPTLPTGFTVTKATNQGTLNGATVWQLTGTYAGPPTTLSSWADYVYGVNYPWSVVTATVTPPLIPMVWNGSECVTAPAQVVWYAPPQAPGSTAPTKGTLIPVEIPVVKGSGGSTTASSSSTTSSKTPYYVAGAGALALAAGAAYWKWGRKARG